VSSTFSVDSTLVWDAEETIEPARFTSPTVRDFGCDFLVDLFEARIDISFLNNFNNCSYSQFPDFDKIEAGLKLPLPGGQFYNR
jgi:hypothetical protein